jgi:hypothetical protein
MVHCCALHRLMRPDEWDTGSFTVQGAAATAQHPTQASVIVNSNTDSAEVVLAGRTAMLDVTLTALPLSPAEAGKQDNSFQPPEMPSQ